MKTTLAFADRRAALFASAGLAALAFTTPTFAQSGSNDDEDDSSMLESSIIDVRRLGGDTIVITIAEGSKWQMSNVPMRLRTPRVGDPVVFKRAALGSYFIRIAGQTGVKGRRID